MIRLSGLFIAALCLATAAFGQDKVNVTMQVLPPYSPYLNSYIENPNKIVLILNASAVNRDPLQVKLQLSITGDNGISITSRPNFQPPQPIILNPGQVKQLTSGEYQTYFDAKNVEKKGITDRQLQQGLALPEGSYTICIKVLDYYTNEAYSGSVLPGCSAPFSITYAEPPQIITPACSTEVVAKQPQNVLFSWMPSVGAGVGVRYELTLKEFPQNTNLNPNDVMNFAAYPVLLKQDNILGTSLLYDLAKPQLQDGKRYVYRIRAYSPTNEIFFKLEGKSEVCNFTYKALAIPESTNITMVSPECNATVNGVTPQSLLLKFKYTGADPAKVQFFITLKEIPQGKSPEEVMQNNAYVPLKVIETGNTPYFTYDQYYPALQPGKKYAWQVKATLNKTDSYSKVCSFTYSANLANPKIALQEPINGQTVCNAGLPFKWTPVTGFSPSDKVYYGFELYEVKTNQTANEAYKKNKPIHTWEFNTTNNYTLPETVKKSLVNGRTYVWRVYVKLNNKVLFGTSIATFQKALSPCITLVSPGNAGVAELQETGGKNFFHFEWKPESNASVQYYKVIFAEITGNETPKQAMQNAAKHVVRDNINATYLNEYKSQSTLKSGTKYAWMVRAYNSSYKGWYDSSAIQVFTMPDDPLADGAQKIKILYAGGQHIQINTIINPNPDNFKGTGTIQLWKDGPKINVSFDQLVVRPVKLDIVNGIYWYVTKGVIMDNLEEESATKYPIALNASNPNADGEYKIKLFHLKIEGKIETTHEKDKQYYIIKDNQSYCIVRSQISWVTGLTYTPQGQAESSYTIKTSDKYYIPLSYSNKFSDTLGFDGAHDFKLNYPNNFKLKLTGKNYFVLNGLNVSVNLSGFITIPDGRDDQESDIEVKFTDEPDWVFKVNPVSAVVPLNKDKSVEANITEAYINLSFNKVPDEFQDKIWVTGLNVPDLNIAIHSGNGKEYSVQFTKAFNHGYGLYCVNQSNTDQKNTVSGFAAKITQSKIQMNNSRIFELVLRGEMYIPFIQKTGKFEFVADAEGLQGGSIDLNTSGVSYLFGNELTADGIFLEVDYAELKTDHLVMNAYLTLKNDGKKGVRFKKIYLKNMYVYPGGDVGFEGKGSTYNLNYQKTGDYNGFVYKLSKLSLFKSDEGMYKLDLTGDLVLADNLATSTLASHISFPLTSEPPDEFKGPMVDPFGSEWQQNDTKLGVTDDGVSGGFDDGTTSFKGDFKLYQDDPVFGNGFSMETDFEIKQPSSKKFHSKMIVAKAPENFTYWFFEAGQEGFVEIPVLPNIVIYGFKGRIYYHMAHKEGSGSIYNDNYVPSNAIAVGLYAEAPIKTQGDDGGIFYAKTATEITTLSSGGIEKIMFVGDAEIVTDGVGTSGQLHAKFVSELDFINKTFDANCAVTGNLYNVVCISNGVDVNIHMGGDAWFLNMGYYEAETNQWTYAIMDVFCGGLASAGAYMLLNTNNISGGILYSYNTGWKGIDYDPWFAVAGKAHASFWANGNMTYKPFQFTAEVGAKGAVSGKGCLIACYTNSAAIQVSMTLTAPSPVCAAGSITVDVPVVPTFSLPARWKDGSFSFNSSCD